jgi:molybdopterin converting factor small subunit
MSLRSSLRRLFGRGGASATSAKDGSSIRVRVLLKGRTKAGWYDVDQHLTLPAGATLATLLDASEDRGVRLRDALDDSPHLKHTLMLNGERCPVDQNLGRRLSDGDEVYLLAPLAGG